MPSKSNPPPPGPDSGEALADATGKRGRKTAAALPEGQESEGAGKAAKEAAAVVTPDENPAAELAKILEHQDLGEKYLRLRAEFDNYIKRTNREKGELFEYGGSNIVRQMLPILDDLRRTVEHARQNGIPADDPVLQGVALIMEKFIKNLETEGVEEIVAVGQTFDPELHEALMTRKSKEFSNGTVIEQFEPGYRYRGRVIRHSKVIVSE